MDEGWKSGNVNPAATNRWERTSKDAHALGAERARRLVDVAAHLSEQDRALVEAVLGRGVEVPVMAEAMGLSPSTLRSRIRRLRARAASKEFAFAALFADTLGAERGSVARKCFLEGLSVRQTAKQLALSVHAVRQHRAAVLAQAEEYAIARARRAPVIGPPGAGRPISRT